MRGERASLRQGSILEKQIHGQGVGYTRVKAATNL